MSFEERLKSLQSQIAVNEAAEKAALQTGDTSTAEKIAREGKPLRQERASLTIVTLPIEKDKPKGKV